MPEKPDFMLTLLERSIEHNHTMEDEVKRLHQRELLWVQLHSVQISYINLLATQYEDIKRGVVYTKLQKKNNRAMGEDLRNAARTHRLKLGV